MLTPWSLYQQDLKKDGFTHDPSQEAAVRALEQVFQALMDRHQASQTLIGRWKQKLAGANRSVRGLYFWGGVGRGKTYLMDTFFDTIPFENKKRLHFHHFMRVVHEGLRQHRGTKNPLEVVANEFADEASLLCFDEFFVSDIGDAMILGNLMQALFLRGVTLVATSNIEPDLLYKDGLQRKLFLPAIELLKAHCLVLNVDGGIDYRLRTLKQVEIFHHPVDQAAELSLLASFERLVPDVKHVQSDAQIDILGRKIDAKRLCDDVALFDFSALCDGPRSQNDYIEIAQMFHAVLISGVPCFNGKNDDSARRFINLVDEFYDRGVKLLMTAEASVENLYQQGKLSFEFKRTVSRLLEMQSEEYLKREHKA